MRARSTTTSLVRGQAGSATGTDRVILWACFTVVVLIGPLLTAAYMFGRMTVPLPQHNAEGAPPRPENSEAPPHGTYLQLAASPHPQPLIERLRRNGFPALDMEVPGRPGVRRVLVGPLKDQQVAETRAQLESKGLQGNSAISRVF